jgi:hypothetical protein
MWIKCSDRLPEKSGEYLVATEFKYSTGRTDYIYSVIHYSAKHKLFCCFDTFDIEEREKDNPYDDVKYWMPIPKIGQDEDRSEAKKAFDDMLGNPMKQIDALRDSVERNKDPERFGRWLDDFAERTAG